MKAYILGAACISPQETFTGQGFLNEPKDHDGPWLSCVEPVYKEHINPVLARRLSRYIKMGVTTALTSLKNAGVEMPGAVITGTGLGSTEDNEKILEAMYEHQERLINPTNFIQSTHNTISSQIAIMLKCHNYNNTYVHRGFSFESALLDGMLLLDEGMAKTALVGGVDAMTEGHYKNYERVGRWRANAHGSLKMLQTPGKGVIPGEGSSHFVISSRAVEKFWATISGLEMIFKPVDANVVTERCKSLLTVNGLTPGDIDLIILGNTGDEATDHFYGAFHSSLFTGKPAGYYKHLCGEYDTAGAFALWLGAQIIRQQTLPEALGQSQASFSSGIRNILIYTHHRGDQHVLILLSNK